METFLRDLMSAQTAQGLDVAAIVHASDAGVRSVSESPMEQGQLLRVVRVARWFTAAFAPVSPSFPLQLNRLIRIRQPDILHIHMPNASAFWCLLLPRARRTLWVVHWHADVLASSHSAVLRWLYWLYRPLEQRVLRRAARIINTSPPYAESSEPLSTHRDRCSVAPLGIADSSSTEAVTQDEQDDSILRTLFVGRLTYYKGLSYLIRAVAGLDSVELRIVGSGEERKALIGLVKALRVEERVRFLGSLTDEEVELELSACDCLCLPSIERTEAFGLVLLEAMRTGRATLATRVAGSGMSWVVRDGETGLLVDPEDDHAIKLALKKLRDDPETRLRMGAAGRIRFLELFTIQKIVAQLVGIYLSCLPEKYQ
ncbi:MAG: glycosyltransferase [Pseudomonadota bacterium]